MKLPYIILLITIANTYTRTYKYPVKYKSCKFCSPITYENADCMLFKSIRMGKYDETKRWLNCGADVNARDKFGNTPLIQAAWEGNVNTIKVLLNHRADINAVNDNKQSALMIAVLGVKRCAIKELLCAGANINLQDCNGNSAIMLATFIERPKPSRDITCMLLQHNPNLKLKNEWRDTLLTLAVRTGNYYLVESIMCHLNNKLTFEDRYKILNQRNCDKETSFLLSAQTFNNRISCFLLKQGADIEKPNKYGNSPLMISILKRNILLMNMLLDCGVDINHQNCQGYTALMFSIINDHVKMTQALLNFNADITLKNYLGNNAIDIARAYRYFDAIKMITCCC
jgi:uncharacterized protein